MSIVHIKVFLCLVVHHLIVLILNHLCFLIVHHLVLLIFRETKFWLAIGTHDIVVVWFCKLQDAQAERLTSLQANKFTS